MSALRPLHCVLIVKGYASSVFPGQSERKFLILAQKQFRKTTCFSPIYGGVCCAKTLLSCFFFLALSGNFHVFWKFDHNNNRRTQYVPGSTRRHSDVALFYTANFSNNLRKGHLQGCLFDFKEREDDTMPHTIRGPPTGRRKCN